jgi:phosphonate C-P lyase system protein PhnG
MICAEGDISQLKIIVENILVSREISVVKEPTPKLIMVKHIDPLDKNEFFLGEVLATYCEVEIDANFGCGCVIGTDNERSLYAAVIDAVIGNNLPESIKLKEALIEINNKIKSDRQRYLNRVLKTKVNFETKREG